LCQVSALHQNSKSGAREAKVMQSATPTEINQSTESGLAVHGYVHQPTGKPLASLVLTHGASSNANAPLLVSLAGTLADEGIAVLRVDLPFRQSRPKGPPSPSNAAKDQQGLRAAADYLRKLHQGKVILGGHSYGGRQATLLAASEPSVCDGLLLLSYPLHPPGNATKLRTAHFPQLRNPALFVQGTRDPFGSVEEMKSALQLVPAPHLHVVIEAAGHDLRPGRKVANGAGVEQAIAKAFCEFFHILRAS
jgi:uncharacterized protein